MNWPPVHSYLRIQCRVDKMKSVTDEDAGWLAVNRTIVFVMTRVLGVTTLL